MIFKSGEDKEDKGDSLRIETARERAMKVETAGEKKPNNPEDKKDIEKQKAETASMKIESEKKDIKNLIELGKTAGINVSMAVQEKRNKIDEMNREAGVEQGAGDDPEEAGALNLLKRIKKGKGEELPEFLGNRLKQAEEKSSGEEISPDLKKANVAKDLLDNVRRAKAGEDLVALNLEGLSEEDKKNFMEAQKALGELAGIKNSKSEGDKGEKRSSYIPPSDIEKKAAGMSLNYGQYKRNLEKLKAEEKI